MTNVQKATPDDIEAVTDFQEIGDARAYRLTPTGHRHSLNLLASRGIPESELEKLLSGLRRFQSAPGQYPRSLIAGTSYGTP